MSPPDLNVLLSRRGEELSASLLRDEAAAKGRSLVVLPYRDGKPSGDVEVAFLSRDLFLDQDLNPGSTPLSDFRARLEQELKLKWVHLCSAGVDSDSCRVLLERGVRLTTSSGATAAPMAQSAVAGLLALARLMPRWMRAQAEHKWHPAPAELWPDDLRGQTAVVVGMGPIGQEIARILKAIGLSVTGVRRNTAAATPDCDIVSSWRNLSRIAATADWMVIACPLTAETQGLVSREVIAAMPARCGFINIARGGLVDEPSLIEALAAGRLLGAYLDVFAKEPLSPESPLWDMPNVLLSPHNAALSTGNEPRHAELFARNMQAYLAGTPMVNEVGVDILA